ncbi:hypothetical protein [Croceivirga sp. JEA036]|uniref:hypothetical protein n=1 Tax=Croceivirga sp. JEA036 TaxID=2721162 RepID=UPI00143AE09F|nr:hypothetical protein [Croceivirga sp. JEA036]NJB35841.1 hypothetical protein [Croceivirga sp. JEA036]
MAKMVNKSICKLYRQKYGVKGLSKFAKVLEKDFIAKVALRLSPTPNNRFNLSLHIDCNYALHIALFQLTNYNWGNLNAVENKNISILKKELEQLNYLNDGKITVDELIFSFTDTSLIINCIERISIEDNLKEILENLSLNYVNITKGLTEMPYEIFTTIYEDTINEKSSETTLKIKPFMDYLDHWGLYFPSNDEIEIFDVQRKVFMKNTDCYLLEE